jgi:hypothetical protein
MLNIDALPGYFISFRIRMYPLKIRHVFGKNSSYYLQEIIEGVTT